MLLTKVDVYDPDVIGEDLSEVFHSARLLKLVQVGYNLLVQSVCFTDCCNKKQFANMSIHSSACRWMCASDSAAIQLSYSCACSFVAQLLTSFSSPKIPLC